MKLRTQLLCGFIAVVCLMSMFSYLVYSLASSIENNVDSMANDRYEKVKQAYTIISEAEIVLNPIYMSILDPAKPLKAFEINEANNRIQKEFTTLDELTRINTGVERLGHAKASYTLYWESIQNVVRYDNTRNTDGNGFASVIIDLELARKAFHEDMQSYIDFQGALMLESSSSAFHSINNAKKIIWATFFVIVLLTLAIGWSLSRRAIGSIRRISSIMENADFRKSATLPRIPILVKDEISHIAHSYNRMADALESQALVEAAYKDALEEENWVKTHLAEFSALFRENQDVPVFCDKFLSQLIPLMNGASGSIYVLDRSQDDPRYSRKAAYAWDPMKAERSSFWLGEGLVGQCAANSKPIELTVPHDYVHVLTGFGSVPPTYLTFLPVIHNDEVIAVLEIAGFQKISGKERILLAEISGNSLGTTLRNHQYRKHVEKLYTEAQAYNEELQVQSEELIQQQEELRALNERLEEQVKISQSNSQYKSEFLANMSHELRTPLNSLLVLAQVLQENREGNLTAKQMEYAQTMVSSGNQLLALINDILDLSKIEAGQMEQVRETFDLTPMIQELTLQFRALMEEKKLAFHVEVEPALQKLSLYSDKQRLMQILFNLLSNALKFTEDGSVSLRVFVPDQQPQAVSFAIKDTGIGIDPRHHTQIFEAFKQVDGQTSRKYGGTGLGLSISQEFAHLIGGEIQVDSRIGVGSTFTLTIPIEQSPEWAHLQAAVTAVEVAAVSGTVSPLPVEEGPTILLADDDLRNIYSLSSALEEYGCKVICAENGTEALSILEDHRVDLILMDIMMPGMDGYEAMQRIRDADHLADIPIIALTAKAMKEDRDLCIEAGADDYISKPVRLDKLMSLIEVWKQGRSLS